MQVQFLQYSQRCFHSLVINLCEAGEGNSIEIVHSIRLNIKRIRALLMLIGYQDNSLKSDQIIKKIDSLFLNAGHLRDIHVQIVLLESFREQVGEEVDFYIDSIKKERKKTKKQFVSTIQRINHFDIFLLNQRVDNNIEALDSSTLENICRLRIDVLLEQIIQIIRDNPNESMLHRIRILLKELIYTFSFTKKGKLEIKYDATFIKYLNSLQQKLGFWHDLVVLSNRMTNDDNHRVAVETLMHRVESDKNAIYAEIVECFEKLSEMVKKVK